MAARSALIILRVVQVLISLAFCTTTGLALAGLAGISVWFNQPGTYDGWKLTPQEVDAIRAGLVGGVAGVAVVLSICLLSLALSLTWLVYTASPRARSRAHCCGNRAVCARYTCDVAWDVLLLLFWALMLAAVAGSLALYGRLGELVDEMRAELEDRHIPRSSLPGPLKGVRWQDLSPIQKAVAGRLANEASIVSSKDLNTYERLSSGAEVFLDKGRVVLLVAVVLASVQVASLVASAALSGAHRKALRREGRSDLVMSSPWEAPKPAAPGMVVPGGGYGSGSQQPVEWWPVGGGAGVIKPVAVGSSGRFQQQQFIRH